MSKDKGLVNLNIVRARNALNAARSDTFGGINGGDIAKKIPPLIMNNGLIAVLSFAVENKNKLDSSGYGKVFKAVIAHLKDKDIKILPPDSKILEVEDLLEYILNGDSTGLRRITLETMLWLEYFRRFAKKG